MKELVCKMCGSNEIKNDGDLFICESCDTKYTTEEVEKMTVEVVVKDNNSEKIQALTRAARRAKEMQNWDSAIKYYDEIMGLDPDNWEAVFFSAYCSAMNCKIMQIESACNLVSNSLRPTFTLLKEADILKVERDAAILLVTVSACSLATTMINSSRSFYRDIDSSIQHKYSQEYANRRAAATKIMLNCGYLIEEIFGEEYSDNILMALKKGYHYYNPLEGGINGKVAQDALDTIEKYDPQYVKQLKDNQIAADKKNRERSIIWFVIFVIGAIVSFYIKIEYEAEGFVIWLHWCVRIFFVIMSLWCLFLIRLFKPSENDSTDK